MPTSRRLPITYDDLKDAFYFPWIDRSIHPRKTELEQEISYFYAELALDLKVVMWTPILIEHYMRITRLVAQISRND
jgi:hypothetical protein